GAVRAEGRSDHFRHRRVADGFVLASGKVLEVKPFPTLHARSPEEMITRLRPAECMDSIAFFGLTLESLLTRVILPERARPAADSYLRDGWHLERLAEYSAGDGKGESHNPLRQPTILSGPPRIERMVWKNAPRLGPRSRGEP